MTTNFKGIWYQRWLQLGRSFRTAKTDNERLLLVFQLLEDVSAHRYNHTAESSFRQLHAAISTLLEESKQ